MTLTTVTVYVAPESTFGDDPDTDGSSYLALRVVGKPLPQTDRKIVPSNAAVGRNREQAHNVGVDGATDDLKIPMIALSAVASDGVAPPTADAVDAVVSAALGDAATKSGEGIASGSTETELHLDTDAFDVEDLVCVNFADRSEWRVITADAGAGVYTISPPLTAVPSASRDVLGYRYWKDSDDQGDTITVYREIGGTGYRLSGCRPGIKISMQAGAEMIELAAALRADSKTRETKASLPAISKFNDTQIKGVLSPVYWGTTKVVAKGIELDPGTSPTDIPATEGRNGRQSIDVLSRNPTVTFETAFSTDLEDDFDAGTERAILVQFGSGVLGSGRASSWCFYARSAQIIALQPADDGNLLRQKVTVRVTDPGIRTGTTPYRFWTLARS